MTDANHDPLRDPETGRLLRLPTYDEESSKRIGAPDLRRKFSWLTEDEAAEQAARAEEDAALLIRTAADVGLDPAWPGEERERLEPEKLGEVHEGLPLWTREQRDGLWEGKTPSQQPIPADGALWPRDGARRARRLP